MTAVFLLFLLLGVARNSEGYPSEENKTSPMDPQVVDRVRELVDQFQGFMLEEAAWGAWPPEAVASGAGPLGGNLSPSLFPWLMHGGPGAPAEVFRVEEHLAEFVSSNRGLYAEEEELRNILGYLAHPGLEGRGTDTQGNRLAREFLQGRLEEFGLDLPERFNREFRLWPSLLWGLRSKVPVFPVNFLFQLKGQNVVGRIEGTNSEETIILMAHYDHLRPSRHIAHNVGLAMTGPFLFGFPSLAPLPIALKILALLNYQLGAGREFQVDCLGTQECLEWFDKDIYPGADDDAAGVTVLLAVAQTLGDLARSGIPPNRNVLFLFTDAEEQGLVGSGHFIDQLGPEDKDRIVAVLNLDMIGRPDPDKPNLLYVGGSPKTKEFPKRNPALAETFEGAAKKVGLELSYDLPDQLIGKIFGQPIFTRGDHYNFFEKVRPAERNAPGKKRKGRLSVAFFFTGFHEGKQSKDYHRTSDTPEKISYPFLGLVTEFVLEVVGELAYTDTAPPDYQEKIPKS